MSLGAQVTKYRKALGLKLDHLAELSDVQPGTISALAVRGSKRSEHGPALAKGLGLSLEQLLDTHTDWLPTCFDYVNAHRPTGWEPTHEVLERVALARKTHVISAPPVEEIKRGSTKKQDIVWPFKLVTYARIERIRKHFQGPGMPQAIYEIDRHLDVLVSRWEGEMAQSKRHA